MRVVMIESDKVVDKQGSLELWILLDRMECNQIFEDCDIEIMGAIKGEAVKAHGNINGDRSHVQEGLKQQPKREGLIYPGNDLKWIMPSWSMEF